MPHADTTPTFRPDPHPLPFIRPSSPDPATATHIDRELRKGRPIFGVMQDDQVRDALEDPHLLSSLASDALVIAAVERQADGEDDPGFDADPDRHGRRRRANDRRATERRRGDRPAARTPVIR